MFDRGYDLKSVDWQGKGRQTPKHRDIAPYARLKWRAADYGTPYMDFFSGELVYVTRKLSQLPNIHVYDLRNANHHYPQNAPGLNLGQDTIPSFS
jgi:hypothetical protein